MNPLGEIAQAIWKNAGEELNEYRRKNVTIPLQEGIILTPPPFKLKSRFKGILKKEEEPSTSVKKKKPPTTHNDSIDGSSDEESDNEDNLSDDDDDEEFVRALINDHRDDIFEKEDKPEGRKRKSIG
ncbi:hypothetical protein PRIPAC_83020 [Pristionchus pacificus]|uniref:Uncharacterized protein n=1 Tax=Pristionchus pacificus TaxID=54126 RepID=A0A2A6CLY0_PRIPA|nr:hypothetical protein PRIPAC_83020 [Pristionchus pacificus]|eukprot:PDM79245.1 hypothetical protein PRIPAC_31824 [Pristionchus pacificus]